jgi:choline dehydrogenase
MANTQVEKIIFDNEKACGVVAIHNGTSYTFKAKRIILCAGAINTPLVLLRSGLGDKDQLKYHDINTLQHLPGVGKNLIDHSAVGLWAIPQDGICKLGEDIHQIMLRYTAPESSLKNDLALFMLNSVDTKQFPELYTALGSEIGLSISAVLGKPASRGFIELTSKELHAPPLLCFNYASDPFDRKRLMDGVRLAWKFLQDENMKKTYKKVFAWNQRIIESDKLLEESILTFVRGSWHAAGTAKMGLATDAAAVVDQYGKVYGCKNLFVIDASIMPSIPSVPTNLTCIMLAEYLAQNIRGSAYEH